MTSTKSQFGYFLLADISGFSSYLTKVELEHAGGILQKLLESIARKIEPVFRVQDFDIDSVFAVVSKTGISRFENLHRLVEDTYVEFKGNLSEISNHITCNCAACRDVTSLDLKFMVHYGEYILSSVQGRPMLYGLDPTFVRNRRWKDAMSGSLGWRGYILFTEQCLTSLGMDADEFQGEKFDIDSFKMIGVELKTNDE
ncbi:MAG: DUF2652 domain-containing protein [Chloroflexi bacterium]|nr:DUF2652 domain-containing protein [Chloroflexota bacterium]